MLASLERPGPGNSLTDVAGLRVGHASRTGDGWLTGTTVVLAPSGGMVAAVDARGGGPATRETDALDPRNLVSRVEALALTGGSAYGLAAADGVLAWLEEHDRGIPVGARRPGEVVPVVPTAALFDLGRGGDFRARPDAELGRWAMRTAAELTPSEGVGTDTGALGAGTGALVGGIRGGVGTASVRLRDETDEVVVAALVVVNAAGSPLDPRTGLPYGLPIGLDGEFPLAVPDADEHRAARARLDELTPEASPLNTVIGVVATDAALDRPQARRLAGAGHDGLARSIRPAHTLFDGDTLFGVATGPTPVPNADALLTALALNAIYAAGADVVSRAVVRALLAAESVTTPYGHLPSYRELYPVATAALPLITR